MSRRFVSQIALAGSAAAALVVASQFVQPVFAGREPGIRQLLAASGWRDSAAARAPWNAIDGTLATLTGQAESQTRLLAEKVAFKQDLLRTGHVDEARADSLASYAVSEARERGVPAALVFGVMMTENGTLKSRSRSNVGAVGLMQIYPRAWRGLRKQFGADLSNDRTNLRYGVFILSHLIHRSTGDSMSGTQEVAAGVRTGLLRYNGCVHGSNTPNCHQYPDVVQRRVEQMALSQCRGLSYDACVAEPMRRMIAASRGAGVD